MNSIDKPTHAINLVKIKKLLKGKVFPSVALSESVINLVHTVNNNFVPIRALNAHDSEAVQPILPHRASKARTPMLFNKFDLFQMPPCLFVKECYIIILMLRGTLGMRLYQIWNKAHFKQSSLKLPFMIDGNSLVLVWDSLFFMG